MKRLRTLGTAIGLSAATLALSVPTSAAATKATTIMWEASAFGDNGLRAKMVKLFEASHPSIKVTIIPGASAANTDEQRLITDISGGATTPDVYLMDDIWPATFGSKGLAVDLSKYVPTHVLHEVPANLLTLSGSYKGQVYGLPFWTDSGFLYYRKDLLAKYHLAVPKTLARLKQEAQLLVSKGAVRYGFVWQGADYLGVVCDYMEYLADYGGKLLNNNGSAAVDGTAGRAALKYMRSLIQTGASPSAVTTYEEEQSLNTFAAGDAAFMRNWSYALKASQGPGSAVVGKVGVAPMPGVTSYPGYSAIGGWDMAVNPHTKHLAAAVTFAEWNLSPIAQDAWAHYITTGSRAPASNPAIVKANPVLRVHAQVKLTSCAPGVAQYAQLTADMYQQLNPALAGTISPSTALARMASGINALHLGPGAAKIQGAPTK